MKGAKHKLTPEYRATLKLLSDKLPPTPRTTTVAGKQVIQYQKITKPMMGFEILDLDQKSRDEINIDYVYPTKQYSITRQVPYMVNHWINLCNCFEKGGLSGVNEYLKLFGFKLEAAK
jgi:hypothetical protein